MFLGFVQLENMIRLTALIKSIGNVPSNADALPTYRIYGPAGLMPNASGALSLQDTGSITGATNANPIVITSTNHGLTTGTRVTISGVGGNTAANGSWVITVIDANTFSLNGSTGNSGYTSGGTWSVTGLYGANYTASAANGFTSGQTYTMLVNALVSTNAVGELHSFTVT